MLLLLQADCLSGCQVRSGLVKPPVMFLCFIAAHLYEMAYPMMSFMDFYCPRKAFSLVQPYKTWPASRSPHSLRHGCWVSRWEELNPPAELFLFQYLALIPFCF